MDYIISGNYKLLQAYQALPENKSEVKVTTSKLKFSI